MAARRWRNKAAEYDDSPRKSRRMSCCPIACLAEFDQGEGVGQEIGQVPQRHARLPTRFPVDHPEATACVNDDIPGPYVIVSEYSGHVLAQRLAPPRY